MVLRMDWSDKMGTWCIGELYTDLESIQPCGTTPRMAPPKNSCSVNWDMVDLICFDCKMANFDLFWSFFFSFFLQGRSAGCAGANPNSSREIAGFFSVPLLPEVRQYRRRQTILESSTDQQRLYSSRTESRLGRRACMRQQVRAGVFRPMTSGGLAGSWLNPEYTTMSYIKRLESQIQGIWVITNKGVVIAFKIEIAK